LRTQKLFWRINNNIRVPEVRLVGADGKQIGVVNINEALSQAKKAGLDLIEIAPKANPPVAKIADLGKFRYQEEKKLQKQKRGVKSSEVKEIRFTPFIAEHDFATRFGRIQEFLEESNKVRVVVVFKGRQMDSKRFGYEIMDRIVKSLENKIVIDMEPKFLGRHLAMVISPFKKGRVQEAKEENKKENKD
jgi:translation initiation factor IF-3